MKPMNTMRLAALSLALLGGAEAASASEVTITAEFRPSSTNTRFKNTTPISGFCKHFPSQTVCQSDEAKSIELGIKYTKGTVSRDPDTRNRFYAGFPGGQVVDVTRAGDSPSQLYFSFASFSAFVRKISGEGRVPNSGRAVRGGCGELQPAINNGSWGISLWRIDNPDAPSPCHVYSDYEGTGLQAVSNVEEFSVGYNLVAPNPLAMRAGIYTGEVNYSVGENGEIALGNMVTNLNTNSLKIKFELDVRHALEVHFPTNSDKVILEPPGGWMRWLNGGPAPEKLVRDLPFRITNTGPLSIYMECEHPTARSCGIQNTRSSEIAALDVAVSLPGGIQLNNGQAVQRFPIPTGRARPLHVDAVTPVFNQPGALHFATAAGEAAEMVKNPGDTYRGNVTVVFDALL
ncbi:hypothetical protein [Pseudomonas defluvii]|uniref:hypothetical protein n=1 Tax=Pseudomonas defluvii TaxID=1876757 RepID=UPI003906159D